MATSLTRRLASGSLSLLLTVGLGLGATACSQDEDVTRDEFLEQFSETSLGDAAFDECVVDELFAQLEQDRLNEFHDTSTSLSDEDTAALQEASATCAAETAGTTEPEDGLDPGSSGDTATTGG